ncbi:class I SAM-dependent methyltransferase [Taibaiella chishuiensis]|uniref:Methyltransferase family protein n=1 Tax=Taibaiella chishuiensis TaxID=1434707 RepID=A0A2P8CSQ2_9BACT|nr:class I SAM-dependent methyltransferase [Taibaiella chishuiensis]PSK88001.1 methyltransferase family protein [Taibaiella chishuiensis]
MQLKEARELISCPIFEQQPDHARWADLGCGPGLFSYALSGLLPADSSVYAIDKEPVFDAFMFPGKGNNIHALQYDFINETLPLHDLDGLLMANALHYASDRDALLDRLTRYVKPAAHLLVVEYDTETPVPVWVPYPLSFAALGRLCKAKGLKAPQKLQTLPSRFGRGNLYAALVAL